MSKKLDDLERLKVVRQALRDYSREQNELIARVYRKGDTVTWTRTNSGNAFIQVGVVLDTAWARVKVRNNRTKQEFWLDFQWLLNV